MMPFFRGQLLELLRWILLFCPDASQEEGKRDADLEMKRQFLKAALIASSLWGERVHEKSLVADGQFLSNRALAFSRHSVDASATAPDLWRTLGRAKVLFRNYIPEEWAHFDSIFQERTGISLREFQISAAALVATYQVKPEDTGLINLLGIGEHLVDREIMDRFMTFASVDPSELKEKIWDATATAKALKGEVPEYNTKPLRETPILRIMEELGAIVDPIFFSELLLVGPLFVNVKSMSRQKSNEAFGKFGNAFEGYSLNILRQILEADNADGSMQVETNIEVAGAEVDAVACTGKLIFAFEAKSTFVPERETAARESDLFLVTLRKRYVEDEESDRPLKGVGQLARLALSLEQADGKLRQFTGKLSQALIFPVLIVRDWLLTAPLTGRFLNEELKAQIGASTLLPSGQMKLPSGLRIAPLTVLAIDDLEDFQTSSKYLSLTEVIRRYVESQPTCELGFRDFIANSKYQKRLLVNKKLNEQGQELIREAAIRLFARDPKLEDADI